MRLEAYAHNKHFPDARAMILDALGIDGDKIPRERAVYIGDNGPIIHTRTGGGNRESYDSIEVYIEGDYGLDKTIKEYQDMLEAFEGWPWHIKLEYDIDSDDQYKPHCTIPYEASYRYPETDEEWAVKEAELRQTVKELEDQKKEVLETGAFTNEFLRNQYYLNDEDDDFDCTYADFFYTWPEGLKERLKKAGYLEDE